MVDIQTYVYEPYDPGYLKTTEGLRLPVNDIEGMRAVANWIHQRRDEGWSVPFLTADGLLLRYPVSRSEDQDDSEPRWHEWVHSGQELVWTGFGFESMGAYRLKEPGNE